MLGITPWYVQVWELPRPLHRRGQVTVQLTVCWVHWARRYAVDIVDIINYNYQVRGLDRDDDKPPGERGGEVDTRTHQPPFIRDNNDRQLNNQNADTEENTSTAKLWAIFETGHQRQHVKWLNPGYGRSVTSRDVIFVIIVSCCSAQWKHSPALHLLPPTW